MSYRTRRGVKNREPQIEHGQSREQWNMDMAQRALENLFPEISSDDGNTVVDYTHAYKYPKYNADTLARRAEEYFRDIYEKNAAGIPIIPDIEDFCNYCNMSRIYYVSLKQSSDIKLAFLCERINTTIASIKKQLAFDGHINPTVFAIDFNNNHDYVQARQQIEMKTTNLNIEAKDSIDDIALRIPTEN